MKITPKQLQMLYQVLMDSLKICDLATPFKYRQEKRILLANNILDQQSNEIIDVNEENENVNK